jgi:hypothetical protein
VAWKVARSRETRRRFALGAPDSFAAIVCILNDAPLNLSFVSPCHS